MIQTMMVAFVVFAVAILGMAAGVILRGRRLKGTCGGLAADGGDSPCMLCSRRTSDCPDLPDETEAHGQDRTDAPMARDDNGMAGADVGRAKVDVAS